MIGDSFSLSSALTRSARYQMVQHLPCTVCHTMGSMSITLLTNTSNTNKRPLRQQMGFCYLHSHHQGCGNFARKTVTAPALVLNPWPSTLGQPKKSPFYTPTKTPFYKKTNLSSSPISTNYQQAILTTSNSGLTHIKQ
jgi:hypothetical protein